MPFYIRKSVSAGPFRFNLSKSGVGLSVGVKGFRIGTGPRGNYVHMGAGGIYYRTTLPGIASLPSAHPSPISPGPANSSAFPVTHEIESAEPVQMQPESAKDLLDQIVGMHQRLRFTTIAAVAGVTCTVAFIVLGLSSYLYIPIAATLILVALSHYVDKSINRVVLIYNLSGSARTAFELLTKTFDDLMGVSRAWHITTEQHNLNRKHNAGAYKSQDRKSVKFYYGLPIVINSNIGTPAIKFGGRNLYFFPDRLLFFGRDSVGAIEYDELYVAVREVQFVEEGTIPSDSQIVGHTWKHPNRGGGPDRRFKNNRQIPVCRYEEVHLRSQSGLNELLQLSRAGLGWQLKNAIETLRTARSADRSGRQISQDLPRKLGG